MLLVRYRSITWECLQFPESRIVDAPFWQSFCFGAYHNCDQVSRFWPHVGLRGVIEL